MRLPIALGSLVLVCLAGMAPPVAGQTFPYRAYATTDNVYVRSGPGDNYYPTDKLKTNDAVEVYRHDPGGWYAIRPVSGSFSWISGRYLQLGKDHVATVTEDHVAARVGSRFSDIRDVIQVRLNRGELVEVLDAQRAGTATSAPVNAWCKIAPPAGEFRWVSSKFLDTNLPGAGQSKTPPGAGTGGTQAPRTMTTVQFQTELDQIDLDLSTMVADEPNLWQFDELHTRSQSLLSQAETTVERGRARLLLSKIARFEDIKQRYDQANTLPNYTHRTDGALARTSPLPRAVSPQLDPTGRYDGVGKLARVTSPKTGAPQYALLDEYGRVRCFVTPAPGVNLRYYLGRQVGINGARGYVPEQQTSHLMAQHINVVDGSAMR